MIKINNQKWNTLSTIKSVYPKKQIVTLPGNPNYYLKNSPSLFNNPDLLIVHKNKTSMTYDGLYEIITN